MPIEILLEKEKVLDNEINEEVDKVKMTSEFVSTMKKMDSNVLDLDPFNLDHNLENFYMQDGVESEAIDFF